MTYTLTLGRLFDIRVDVHASWLVVFALVTWSVGTSLPYPLPTPLGFAVAALCSVLLGMSLIAHEFAHALTARRYGVRTLGVTLFLFGGVATLEAEPPTPASEFAIAIAGPLLSAVVAAFAYVAMLAVERLAPDGTAARALWTIFACMAVANAVVACFNLVPAFPMDGGRVVRALLWFLRKDQARATATASAVSCGLGVTGIVASAAALGVGHSWEFAWTAFLAGFIAYNGWTSYRAALRTVRARGGAALTA
jgi:Zn-dependent protease